MICHKCKFCRRAKGAEPFCGFGHRGEPLGNFDGIAPQWCPIGIPDLELGEVIAELVAAAAIAEAKNRSLRNALERSLLSPVRDIPGVDIPVAGALMPKPKGPGRPRGRRTKSLTVTLTADEYKLLQAEAIRRGMTLANLVRERLGAELASYSSSSSVGTAATSSAPAAARMTGE